MDDIPIKMIVAGIVALFVNSGILLYVVKSLLKLAKDFIIIQDHVDALFKTVYGNGEKGIAYKVERIEGRLDAADL